VSRKHPTVARRPFLALPLLLAAGLAGCGMLRRGIGTRHVTLVTSPDLNDDTPLAVDLVFVKDDKLLERLSATSAREWFRNRSQIERDFPRGVEVVSFELVPDQTLPPLAVPGTATAARAGMVFADYRVEGEHRALFGHINRAVIRLGKDSFTVEGAQ
jgi:type VI secretion system protein